MSVTFPQSFDLAARLGLVGGVSAVNIVTRSANIQTVQPPLTLGANNLLQLYAAAEESWEIVSSDVNDTNTAGTGARSVLISYLDGDFVQQQTVVNLNGTTAVAVAADCFRHQSTTVITAGSGQFNAGALTIRVAGGGAVRGFVSVGHSASRQGSFTVPAGRTLYLQNTNYLIGKGSGPGVSGTIASYVHLPSGVLLLGLDFTVSEPGVPINLLGGLTISEKITLELRVQEVSANDTDIAAILTGLLIQPSALQWPLT